jgi:hypothetical protein
MSTVEEIERAVEQLRPPDFARFAAWLERKRAEEWDRQIEADAKAGRLDKFIDEALTWARSRNELRGSRHAGGAFCGASTPGQRTGSAADQAGARNVQC